MPMDHYVDVLPGNWLYGDALGTTRVNEGAAHFLGFVAIALAAIGLFARARPIEGSRFSLRPLVTFFVAMGFLLSLGPDIQLGSTVIGPGPYRLLYEWVPGFQSVRYPERFTVVLVLGLAPLVAAGLSRLRNAGGVWLAHLLGVLLLIEHLSVPLALDAVATGEAIPEVYRWMGSQESVEVVAEVPTARYWHWRADADTMYFSTVHWKRTLQGFTGFVPPTFHFVRWRLFHFPSDASVSFLEKMGVDTVVIRPEAGLSRESFEDDPRFTIVGPFSEGHFIARLNDARELRYEPPARGSEPDLLELDPETWRVHGSAPGAGRARDRDDTTAWMSDEEMQREHHFYAIRFAELTVPRRISMEIGLAQPFPTEFQVLGLTEKGTWVDIPFDREGSLDAFFSQLLSGSQTASLSIDLEDAPKVREIRIRITDTDRFEMPWTMSEIRVYVSRQS